MRFYKQTDDGYLVSIGTGIGETEISETEYNEILNVIQNKPLPTETVDYMLKEDLTWEAYEVEPIEEPDIDADEALNIILGETI